MTKKYTKQLSSEQIHQFQEQGYFLSEPLFSADELEQMKLCSLKLAEMASKLDGMVMHKGSQFVVSQLGESPGERVRIHRVVWCGGAMPELLALGQKSELVDVVSQLLETQNLTQIINQMHLKFPGDGVQFPFHQDSRHRGYGTSDWEDVAGNGSYIQTVCAIDRVTLENGPMIVIPGSHKQGHLDLSYPDEFDESLPQGFEGTDVITVTMEPGQVLFFGPYLIHGSKANESTEPRRIFINGFTVSGANKKEYPGCKLGVKVVR